VPAGANAPVDEDVLGALERWQEEPLDLSTATAAELALFPWLDLATAERILGLREAGGLRRLEDLRQVPGVDAETVAALAPFVSLEPGVGRLDAAARVDLRVRQGAPPLASGSVHGRLPGGPWVEAGVRSVGVAPDARRARAAAGWLRGGTEWLAGPMRARVGLGLLEGDPGGRSHTGPVGVGRAFGLQPHRSLSSDPRWSGLGVVSRGGRTHFLLGLGRPTAGSAARVLAAVERAPPELGGAGAGIALLRREGLHDVSLWGDWEMPVGRGRLEIARLAAGTLRYAAVVRLRGDRWRLGTGIGGDARGGGDGVDPIAGQALDRPHGVVQLDGARRLTDGWSLEALWRRVERGGPGEQARRERAQLAAQGAAAGASWRAWVRVDRAADPSAPDPASEPPALQLGVRWRDERADLAFRRELAARREWTSTGGRTLVAGASVAGAFGSDRSLEWRMGASACTGNRTSLWVVGVPGLGVDSAWIEAGGVRLLAALARPRGRFQAAVAAALQAGPQRRASAQIQLRLDVSSKH
jgi:hypothetical protein